MSRILDGKRHAADILRELALRIDTRRLLPRLAIVLVGNDPASVTYVRMKRERASEIGISTDLFELPEDASAEAVALVAGAAVEEPSVHGVMLQLPLPAHLPKARLLEMIPPEKDVDGLRFLTLEPFGLDPIHAPATPLAVLTLLEREGIPVAGRNVAVFGSEGAVGAPLCSMLADAGAHIIPIDIGDRYRAEDARDAEVLITAVGKPGLITPEFVKPGATVIDVGFARVDGKPAGDVGPGVAEIAGRLSPVPGGIGPLTIAMLLSNVVAAAEQQSGYASGSRP